MPVSDWVGNIGNYEMEGINVTIPWLLGRLSQRSDPQTLDLLGMGPGIDVCEHRLELNEFNDTNPVGVNGVKSMNNMSLKVF